LEPAPPSITLTYLPTRRWRASLYQTLDSKIIRDGTPSSNFALMAMLAPELRIAEASGPPTDNRRGSTSIGSGASATSASQ
jgi:hypothetical protein